MADYRFIQIEQDEEEEEEFETEEDEIEIEFEEDLIPDRIIDLNPIHELEEDDDDDRDYDDYDEEDEEEDDDEEEYIIPEIILPVNFDLINELEDEDDSDYDDDYDYDYDDDDDYGEEDYEDDEELEELIPSSPERVVSSSVFGDRRSVVLENSNSNDFDERKEEVNRCDVDGLNCPICFEAWTGGGQHQISCLPCGHLYGLSCIKKWLLQRQSSGKCPQCNQLCTLKDVRVLYASRLCVADEELHKRVRSLEARCAYLEQKHDELIIKICSNPTLVERLETALADLL